MNEMKQYRRYFPRVRIRSTVFIFVAVSITSLYNGGLKNGNFVVKSEGPLAHLIPNVKSEVNSERSQTSDLHNFETLDWYCNVKSEHKCK
jgi:hypothetical protein